MPSVSEKQHRAMEAAAHGHSTLGIPKSIGQEFVAADSAENDCAGIIFRAPGPLFLLLKRSDTGEWNQPGGHLEDGESAEEAAVRECEEEIGGCPAGKRVALRTTSLHRGSGEYTTFLQDVPAPFKPKLNDEHVKWNWSALENIPNDTIPALKETLRLISGTELDIAKRIQSGHLFSPQKVENIFLFDVRITGTGTAYRPAHDEVVYRPPENFLTEEFLERCHGLPLVFEHPDSSILNTDEFRQRSIGTVILPYIKGEEVWGIAKVFDADAAALMQTSHVSTSPAVVFRDAGSTESVDVDGKSVLIEGKPSYLDHLAICEVGVWDKGGEPSGVNLSGVQDMDEENKVPAWADALMKRMDSMHERLDSFEKKDERKDASKKDESEETAHKAAEELDKKKEEKDDAADKKDCDAREDSEEEAKKEERQAKELEKLASEEREEGEREKREDSRKDSKEEKMDSVSRAEVEALRRQLANMTKPLTAADREALAKAQARADGVGQLFGMEITPPLHGESPIDYRKRLAAKFQKFSGKFKEAKLDSIEGPTFDVVEEHIYNDAISAGRSPTHQKAGVLIPMTRRDSAGREITTFEGDPMAWMQHFMSPGAVARIDRTQIVKGAR